MKMLILCMFARVRQHGSVTVVLQPPVPRSPRGPAAPWGGAPWGQPLVAHQPHQQLPRARPLEPSHGPAQLRETAAATITTAGNAAVMGPEGTGVVEQ